MNKIYIIFIIVFLLFGTAYAYDTNNAMQICQRHQSYERCNYILNR